MSSPQVYPVHSLVVEADERQATRINARRARDEARRIKWQRAKLLGADIATLDEQCSERSKLKAEEAAADQAYAQAMAEASRVVEAERAQFEQAAAKERQDLNHEWQAQRLLPKNNAPRAITPVDVDTCGLSSVQKLEGEDVNASKRRSAQHLMMRQWTLQQVTQKEAKRQVVIEEDKRMAEWEAHLAECRAESEKQASAAAAHRARRLRDEYAAMAAAKHSELEAEKRLTQAADAAEIERNLSDPLLCEARSIYTDGRVRSDHFRGFTEAQTRQIYKENARLEQLKQLQHQRQVDEDTQFAMHLDSLVTALDRAEFDKQRLQRAKLQAVKADLEKQRQHQAQLKLASKRNAFGEITDGGILHGFGKSCR